MARPTPGSLRLPGRVLYCHFLPQFARPCRTHWLSYLIPSRTPGGGPSVLFAQGHGALRGSTGTGTQTHQLRSPHSSPPISKIRSARRPHLGPQQHVGRAMPSSERTPAWGRLGYFSPSRGKLPSGVSKSVFRLHPPKMFYSQTAYCHLPDLDLSSSSSFFF